MKKYITMMSFVLIMGFISTAVLMGANLITEYRIAKNAEYTWKTSILIHHEIEFTDGNFDEVFTSNFTETSAEDSNGTKRYLYTNNQTGNVSYQFSGGGLWDTIRGVISLESDFQTIIQITVTQQGETPGLGGIVAEKNYLDNYRGKKFDETQGLVAVKNPPTTDYEVDAITGATGTSNAFVGLLSVEYRIMRSLFGGENPLAPALKAIMRHNNVTFTDDDYETVFNASFDTITKSNLTLYSHKTNGHVSFIFTADGFNGPIEGVLTLNSDFITIVGIQILSQSEGWGARIQTDPEFFDTYIGKKINPTISFVEEPTNESEIIDGYGGATTTKSALLEMFNHTVATYKLAFGQGA